MPPSKRSKSSKRSPTTPPDSGVPTAEVWLTDPAVDDLRRLDGAALVWALKKLVMLERSPMAGEPLLGSLIGYRKLVVGDRDWRIVWRPTVDERGAVVIEVAEVWAVGARSDGEVYSEMAERVAAMPESASRRSLAAVIAELGKYAKGVAAHPPYQPPSRPEQWLVDRLVHTAGLHRTTVEAMTTEEAVDAWTDYMLRSR